MKHLRAYRFIADSPNWVPNVLLGSVCALIPAIGPIVFWGYAFEVAESLHRRGDGNFPDFDFNRFVKYLVRGVWPWLVHLPVQMVFTFALIGLLYVGFFAIIMAGSSGGPVGWIALLLFGLLLLLLFVHFLIDLLLAPLALRMGLSQELAFAVSLRFAREFLSLTWKELLIAQLFLWVTSLPLLVAGALIPVIGGYIATVVVELAQAHLLYQLYELYLKRGGLPVPLRLEELSSWQIRDAGVREPWRA